MSDFVTLSTPQTVTGDKTFASDVIPGGQKTDGTRGRLFLPSSLGTGAVDIFVDTETGIDGETPVSGAGGNAAWEVSTHRAHAVLNVSGERKELALYGHRHTVSEISGLLGTDGLILSSLLPSVQSPVTSVAGLAGDITVSALRDALTDTDHLFVTSAEKSLWTSKWTWSEEAVKAVKVDNAVNADRLGGVLASDYVRTAALEDFCEGYLKWGALPQDKGSIQMTNGLGQSRSVSLHGHHHAVSDVDTGDGWDALLGSAAPSTLSGWGIKDAYTKAQVDTKLAAYLPLAGGTMSGAIRYVSNGNRYLTLSKAGLHWDFSDVTGGHAEDWLYVTEPDGSQYAGMGVYGGADGLNYLYIGGSYTAPWIALRPSGNVGIGTTAPAYKLDVAGTLRATDDAVVKTLKFSSTAAEAHLAFGRTDNWNYITTPGENSALAIAPGGTVSGAGAALTISNTATYPGYHNGTIALGTSSYRWSNVYSVLGNFSGRITAAGLTSSASIVANAGLSTTTLSASGAATLSSTLSVTGLIKALDGVQIGSTSDIGWYNHNSRIAAGINTARGVNVGSLLVSSAWADYTKVPANGIYSKGEIVCSSDIYPDVTASVKLGTATKRWLGVYAQNGSFSGSVSVSSLNVVTEATVKTLVPDKLHLPSSLGNEVFDIYVDTEVNIDGETPVSVSFQPLWYGLVSSSGSASKIGGSATVSVTRTDTGYYAVSGVPTAACVIAVPALITAGAAVTQHRYSATVTRVGNGCTVNMFSASDTRANYGFYLMIL